MRYHYNTFFKVGFQNLTLKPKQTFGLLDLLRNFNQGDNSMHKAQFLFGQLIFLFGTTFTGCGNRICTPFTTFSFQKFQNFKFWLSEKNKSPDGQGNEKYVKTGFQFPLLIIMMWNFKRDFEKPLFTKNGVIKIHGTLIHILIYILRRKCLLIVFGT